MSAGYLQGVRYAVRRVRRAPGFFAFSVIMIGAVAGINTLIFSLVDALLLRPLPVRSPQNLVQLFEKRPNLPPQRSFDYAFLRQLEANSSTLFDFMGMNRMTAAMESGGAVSRIDVEPVTAGFFPSLAPGVVLGRELVRGDDHTAVLAFSTWVRSFGRDPRAIGRRIHLGGHLFEVVGVMPENFNGTTLEIGPDVWVPRRNLPDFVMNSHLDPDRSAIEIIARLKPHVSLAAAEAEVSARWRRYEQNASADGEDQREWLADSQLEIQSIQNGVSALRKQFRNSLLAILAGSGLLLLAVSFNVGGLLLARSLAYQKEISLRLALGASRARILRNIFAESLAVGGAGGLFGLICAYSGVPLFLHWVPPVQVGGELRSLSLVIRPDTRVVAFCIGVCVLAAIASAIAPAWRSLRIDLLRELKTSNGSAGQSRLQFILCALQIGLCTVLLLCAGLIVHSFSKLQAVDPGFDGRHVAIFSIDPRMHRYSSEQTWALQQRLLAAVRTLPDVKAAGLADAALMRGVGMKTTVVLPGQRLGGSDLMNSSTNNVTPGYLEALGIPLIAGRAFGQQDIGLSPPSPVVAPVLVNQTFVRHFLKGGDPIGRRFATGKQFLKPAFEIVGVVGDTHYRSLRETPPPIFYQCDFGPKTYPEAFTLHVRTVGDPRRTVAPVFRVLRSLDPEMPFYETAALSSEIERSLWQEELVATLASCFGLFAALLSGIGLYSILSYFVTIRNREIGVRMALGAKTSDVCSFLGKRAGRIIGAGAFAGFGCFLLVGGWIQSLLYEVPLVDPIAIMAALGTVIPAAVLAITIPVRRALATDPASALKHE